MYLLPALNGLAMFIAAAPADAMLCDLLGNPYGNLLTPAFVGCDLAFGGLIGYVIAKDDDAFDEKIMRIKRKQKEV